MHAADQQSRGPAVTVVLRWLCVLPGAWLASWPLYGLGGFAISLGGLIDPRGPGYPAFLFPLAELFPTGLMFVLAGSFIAPRRRFATAGALAAICGLLSLQVHVGGQSRVGLTNYMHATGELLGALVAVALVGVLQLRRRRTPQSSPEESPFAEHSP